jgi:hypothetical protein
MLAVSHRPSISAGARASALAVAAASADAEGLALGGRPGRPLRESPSTPQPRSSVSLDRCHTAATLPPASPCPVQARRSMADPGAPPPSALAAYVQDRAVASSSQARASQKEQLIAALQGRASTVDRILGAPPQQQQQQQQQQPGTELASPAAGPGGQWAAQLDDSGGNAAWSCEASPRAKGVFVWEEEETPPEVNSGLLGGADDAPPLHAPGRVSRTPSPASGHSGRASLAASAALAVAARSPSPLGGQGGGAGSRAHSPLGSTRSGAEARRASTAAFLQGSQGLINHITTAMPVVSGAAVLVAEPSLGLGGEEGRGDGGTRHSAVGDAVRARLSHSGEEQGGSWVVGATEYCTNWLQFCAASIPPAWAFRAHTLHAHCCAPPQPRRPPSRRALRHSRPRAPLCMRGLRTSGRCCWTRPARAARRPPPLRRRRPPPLCFCSRPPTVARLSGLTGVMTARKGAAVRRRATSWPT